MNDNSKADALLITLTAAFALLVPAFYSGAFSRPTKIIAEIPPTAPVFKSTAPVRLSAKALIESEGDTSGMMCYSCHKEDGSKPPLQHDANGLVTVSTNHLDLVYARMNCAACHPAAEEVDLEWDDSDRLIIPAAHAQPPMRHGRFGRNNDCFNCHIPDKLDHLRTRQGQEFELKDSTLLCASCHGPAYREWEMGIHGRRSGYWLAGKGESKRLDCTGCHDPHSPAFPAMKPGPHPYRTAATSPENAAKDHDHE